MSRHDRQRLEDVRAAIEAIHAPCSAGTCPMGWCFDAVRVRLIEIGEAVKSLPGELLAHEPHICPMHGLVVVRKSAASGR